jgi:hypothetical protein
VYVSSCGGGGGVFIDEQRRCGRTDVRCASPTCQRSQMRKSELSASVAAKATTDADNSAIQWVVTPLAASQGCGLIAL